MARRQLPQNINLGSITTTPSQLSVSEIKTTSFIIQAPEGNTDFIRIGNSSNQFYELAPGDTLEVHGDNLDNGTSGFLDLREWYVVAVSGTQTGNILYLERY